jgi:predicted Zn-dependent protease
MRAFKVCVPTSMLVRYLHLFFVHGARRRFKITPITTSFMIIIHDNILLEAEAVSRRLKEVFGFDNKILFRNLDDIFVPIAKFNGFDHSSINVCDLKSGEFKSNSILILTPKDLYQASKEKEEDWIFGYCLSGSGITVASTARMKRYDSKPSNSLEVPTELYLKRIEQLAVHEVGHDVVKASHFKMAKCVNPKTGYTNDLGEHCTDNRCVMYEMIDMKIPSPEENYLLLGDEKRFDAGLDDQIKRMYPEWFCERCRKSIHLDKSYFS